MKNELKQDFTMRISSANRTELLVVLYEICIAHMEDALKADDYESMKESVAKARKCLTLLRKSLNFEYPIAYRLANIYRFADTELAMVVVKKDTSEIPALEKVIGNLKDAYAELAAKDGGAPLMQNTEQVYTGLTYGKSSRYETNVQGAGGNRGFLA